MGRPSRGFAPGEIYHVTARGSRRHPIFRAETDRIAFLASVGTVTGGYGLRCLAYCLMTNHYHALYQTLDGRLSDALRDLHGGYSRLCRTRHGTDAHLFRNRFGAELIDTDEYLLTASAYIDLNPVRAGIVDSPEQYRWSSHRAIAGYEPIPLFLGPGLILSLVGGPPEEAPIRYRGFVASRAPALRRSDERSRRLDGLSDTAVA